MSAALLPERMTLFHGGEMVGLGGLPAAVAGHRRSGADRSRGGGEEKSSNGSEKDFF
jgi:hypothetical protein